jgi:putative ABC transport system substrate-binding protein
VSGDPVSAGLVASLARPGGNVTGLSIQQTDLAGKRLELLREVIPGLRRVAMISDPTNSSTVLDLRAALTAAHTLNLDATVLETRRGEDIASAIEALNDRPDALYVVGSPLMFTAPDHRPSTDRSSAHGFRAAGIRGSWRSDIVWSKLPGHVSAHRGIRR